MPVRELETTVKKQLVVRAPTSMLGRRACNDRRLEYRAEFRPGLELTRDFAAERGA
jgi:hypothetical protein